MDADLPLLSIDEAIEYIGFGAFHWVLLGLSGVGFAASTIELVLPSLLLPVLASEWHISSTAAGALMSTTFAGEVLGGLLWGAISDKLGRRAAYRGTSLLAATCALLSATCSNFQQFLAARFGLGFALGGAMAIDFVFFMEFAPKKQRGSRSTLIILAGIVGLFMTGLFGHFILPAMGWRAFLVACAAPSTILAFARLLWPWESPRYLASRGREREAATVLHTMAKRNGTYLPNLELQTSSEVADIAPVGKQALLNKQTMALAAIFFLHTFAYYGMTTWFGKFANHYGLARPAQSVSFMLIAICEVPGLLLTCRLIDRIGRRPILFGNLLGATICVFSMSFIPSKSALLFQTASCCSYFFIVGVWAGLYIYGPELFPTTIRSRAFAACGTMGKLGGFVSPLMFGAVWDHSQQPLKLANALVAGSFAFAALIALLALHAGIRDTSMRSQLCL